MIRLAANLSFLFQDSPFLERMDRAAAAGFRGVEAMFPEGIAPTDLAEKMQTCGLEWVLVNTPAGDLERGERGLAALPGQEARFREAVDRALELAGLLRTPLVHAMAGIPPPGADPAACDATYRANLAWAAERAAERDITITIEAINPRDMPGYYLAELEQALALVTDMNLPGLRLQFDVYHAQVCGGDVETRLHRALPATAHVQIANPPGRHGPGQGELDLPRFLRVLDQAGYGGWVGCEYRPVGRTEDELDWARPFGLAPRG